MPGSNLTREEAQERAAVVTTQTYVVELDLVATVPGGQDGGGLGGDDVAAHRVHQTAAGLHAPSLAGRYAQENASAVLIEKPPIARCPDLHDGDATRERHADYPA